MNQTHTVNIIAAIVDTSKMTLYMENGDSLTIPQGDTRLSPILDRITPALSNNTVATVPEEMLAHTESATFKNFEKESSLVRFFRVAKSVIAKVFPIKEEEPQYLGNIPVTLSTLEKQKEVLASIIAHAVPVSSASFAEDGMDMQKPAKEADGKTSGKHTVNDSTDTLIAVVNGVAVPGVERIKSQFQHSVKSASVVGMENFLKRISKVIHLRQHSIDDLFKFLEKADLPIADDGTIIIYKVLRRSLGTEGLFLDIHSSKVKQRVGSFVCMAPDMVDPDRKNECSNGLHVARRGYISHFPGDVCVVAKLAPEDVIAVPLYDANKMRVCGYHIVAELTKEQYSKLNKNQPITDTEDGRILLANVIAGNHIGVIETVTIGGHKGANLSIKAHQSVATEPVVLVVPKSAVDNAVALPDVGENCGAVPVNPLDVVKKVEESKKLTQAQQIALLLPAVTPEQAHDVVSLKRSFKKGWAVLGVNEKMGKKLEALAERY